MGVTAIWRYPVKAMLGELLQRVEVTRGGLLGDRRWVVTDARTGAPIANKRGQTDPRLRACRAALDGERLRVTLPGGRDAGRAEHEIDAALSVLLERPVRLVAHGPQANGGYLDTAGHHDLAPLHLMSERTRERMRALAPGSRWDFRRFRPNLVLDDHPTPGGVQDDDLLGASLGSPRGLRLHVGLPTPRCVVTTRAQEELPADPGVLRAIARDNRRDLGPFGRPACLGLYAEVRRAGSLAVGETLAIHPRRGGDADTAVAETVARIAAELRQ